MTRRAGDGRGEAPEGAGDLWGFFAFSHGWTWLFWGILVLSGIDVWASSGGLALLFVGGLGVPAGGVLMTWRTGGTDAVRTLGRRLVDPRPVRGWWWVAVLLLLPAVKLAAIGLASLAGDVAAPVDLRQAGELVTRPGRLLSFVGFLLLLGPLPEEIGWRGYLLDRLQLRFGALGASVGVGLAWFAWHLPLFFVTGYFARAGGAPDPIQFGTAILLVSVLYTWIHNNTGRSVLAAVLFHLSGNVSGELLDVPAAVSTYETYLTAAAVLAVLSVWGGDTLRRRPDGNRGSAPSGPPPSRGRG